MDPVRLDYFKKAVSMPNGIILCTGPTGSGKTTSLYAAMNYIRSPGINISTVEDPIEYNITGVNQTQVNTITGMTFANALRTLLRQDPDVIMVGEMRDRETAEIAIRSSLTGHLVLSTLHTNDAASAITRLIDMGIEPYLVSSSVTMIIAQRLVRQLCTHCRCEAQLTSEQMQSCGIPENITCFKGLGCSRCGYTGYKGRIGIFEVLPVSDSLRTLINKKAYASEIRDIACKEGMMSLREHAFEMLRAGITSVEEVVREIAVV
jgi:type IV pilus assembly protein PilB